MSDGPRTTYLTTETIPLPFCPGCGHQAFVQALDRALVRLQPEPHEVVIVTDIGCIGLADQNFTTSGFHGLHGRSITYACGLKLARPELTVIAVMGDGACGIGGTHLLNVARRNIGITLLVANNLNYGMTGGQHSVTTPTDGRTSTTPAGNLEAPLDICATAAAAGASWVHRASTFDRDLDEVIATAIREPGFSMVEVWELCTAYYSPRNQLGKKDLFGLLDRLDFTLGRIADAPRPEYSARYREVVRSAQGPRTRPIEVVHASSLSARTGLLIAGEAGQKIRSSATVFGRAAISCGLDVTQKDDYPVTVMTGHSVTELILDREPIDYTGIESPDVVLVLGPHGLRQVRARLAALPDTAVVYLDQGLPVPDTKARVRRLPFVETGRRVGRFSVGLLGLATVIEEVRWFPGAAFEAAIRASGRADLTDIGLRAFAAGRDLAIP